MAAVDEEAVGLLTNQERVRADGDDGDVERAEGWFRSCFVRAEVDVRDDDVRGELREGAAKVLCGGDDSLKTVVMMFELIEKECSARNGSILAKSKVVRRL